MKASQLADRASHVEALLYECTTRIIKRTIADQLLSITVISGILILVHPYYYPYITKFLLSLETTVMVAICTQVFS